MLGERCKVTKAGGLKVAVVCLRLFEGVETLGGVGVLAGELWAIIYSRMLFAAEGF